MRVAELRVEPLRYDLELTLYPSFILTMFTREQHGWVKLYGYARGTRLVQEESLVKVYLPDTVPDDVALELTGLWYDPEDYVQDVKQEYRDFVEKLIECASPVRIAISRRDIVHIFVSVFLSRNTDYYTNVIRWVHRLCELTQDDLTRISQDLVKQVSGSYQVAQLPDALREFLQGPYMLIREGASYWDIRKALLHIRNVGPKVADAFLIFTGLSTSVAPSDIHFRRFVQRLHIFDDYTLPDKKYCMRYTCEDCPRASHCLTGRAYRVFGRLSSWIQTVSYVIDRKYCSEDKCAECPLYARLCHGK